MTQLRSCITQWRVSCLVFQTYCNDRLLFFILRNHCTTSITLITKILKQPASTHGTDWLILPIYKTACSIFSVLLCGRTSIIQTNVMNEPNYLWKLWIFPHRNYCPSQPEWCNGEPYLLQQTDLSPDRGSFVFVITLRVLRANALLLVMGNVFSSLFWKSSRLKISDGC